MTTQRTALVIGATGLIGGHLVSRLLADPTYSKVVTVVRRPFFSPHPKLTEIVVDFERLSNGEAHFAVDDIFCCLGTTTKDTPDPVLYRKIDVEYPLESARLGKKMGAKHYLIVTAVGADPNSKFAYLRLKGEVQEEISELGFDAFHIFQPSLLVGRTERKRPKEILAIWIANALKWVYPKPWQKYLPIEGSAVASAMIACAKSEKKGMFIYTRSQILQLQTSNG